MGVLPSRWMEAQWTLGQCAPLWIELCGFESWPGSLHCLLGKIVHSDSLCLFPPEMGTRTLYAGGNPLIDWNPIQGGVEIVLVASCYINQNKLWPDGQLGLYADLPSYLTCISSPWD